MRKQRFLKAVAGFTLIELIVVMALLAIASSIAVPIIISNTNEKKKETYRQACISVFENATSIADAYSKGAKTIGGVSIDPDKGTGGIKGVKTLLDTENTMDFRFDIVVKSTATNPSVNYSKDTIVVYFIYSPDKTKAIAVGCWYMLKGNTTPQFKYDYAEGPIAIGDTFTAPVYS